MPKESLYPHVPKSRQPKFPHVPGGRPVVLPQTEKASAELKYFWVEKNLPYDTWAIVEAWPGGTVRSPFETKEEAVKQEEEIAEGIWEIKQVPSPQEKFPKQHEVLKGFYPYEIIEYHDDGDLTIQSLEPLPRPKVGFKKGYIFVVTTDGKIFKQERLPATTEKLYQRGPDGYPIGADKIMRDAWGPIPDPDQPFWSGKGFIKPVKIYGWQWSPDYHSWRAYVRFPDGTETWTSPLKQTGGNLERLASTEGDPIRKFCCRQCGECAPKELLEDGRFLDRISWLRSHYKEKHPGMWGSPMTVEDGEPVPPQYRHLVGLVSEPLPKEAE